MAKSFDLESLAERVDSIVRVTDTNSVSERVRAYTESSPGGPSGTCPSPYSPSPISPYTPLDSGKSGTYTIQKSL